MNIVFSFLNNLLFSLLIAFSFYGYGKEIFTLKQTSIMLGVYSLIGLVSYLHGFTSKNDTEKKELD